MPTYQYSCTECGHFLEQFQSFHDDSLTACPDCGGRLRKVFNAVGVVFKGSGFYRNDSRVAAETGSSASSNGAAEKASSESSDGSSSEAPSKAPGSSSSDSSKGSASNGSSSKASAGAPAKAT